MVNISRNIPAQYQFYCCVNEEQMLLLAYRVFDLKFSLEMRPHLAALLKNRRTLLQKDVIVVPESAQSKYGKMKHFFREFVVTGERLQTFLSQTKL